MVFDLGDGLGSIIALLLSFSLYSKYASMTNRIMYTPNVIEITQIGVVYVSIIMMQATKTTITGFSVLSK